MKREAAELRRRIARLEADLWTARAALADIATDRRLGIVDPDMAPVNAGTRALTRCAREAEAIGKTLAETP
jgi:hypothetical protein